MGYDRAPREEHEVQCADCGTTTTVPFKPTGDRPVYCRDCFEKHRPPRREGGGFRDRGPRRDFGGGGGGGGGGRRESRGPPRDLHDAVCSNCGAQTQVPFKPTPGRDVFCRDCFAKTRA